MPVVNGLRSTPNMPRLKHFGAAASSSGGVELFPLVGVTPDARTREQVWEAAQLIEGRQVRENSALWIFTPSAIKAMADRNGYTRIIEKAGGKIMTDSCSAMSRAVPKGTKVVALDSAKQAHYLPAILGVQAWFGTTAQCIDAACTGRWSAGL